MLYFLVFTASFCLMVLEIVAGRVVAPYVGSSIYTWTSIIGIFLLGITLGNWLGGRLADKYPEDKLFAPIFLLSSAAGLLMIYLAPAWLGVARSNSDLPLAMVLFSLITFFPVAFFLSFVSPLAIRLGLKKIEKTGRTVGNIYGVSAAGSILGTFLTGFWLIPSFGTREVIGGVFTVLAIVGLYFTFRRQPPRLTSFLFLILLAAAGYGTLNLENLCLVESQYYCIRINEITAGSTATRGLALVLDQLEHSHIYPSEVDPFGDDYVRLFSMMARYKFKPQDQFKVLAIGGGGYVLPRYLVNTFPRAEVTVIEIDPAVTRINFEKLGLMRSERLTIIHGDARMNMHRLGAQKFDLVYVDAFNDFLVPFHLTTREFVNLASKMMNENGLYVVNVIDDSSYGRFLSSGLLTISSVFSQVYIFPLDASWPHAARHASVILGTNATLDQKRWQKIVPEKDPLWAKADRLARENVKKYYTVAEAVVREFNQRAGGFVLTDNYAPVENMLAHLVQRL